jgi:hypothetical protein
MVSSEPTAAMDAAMLAWLSGHPHRTRSGTQASRTGPQRYTWQA